MAKQFFIILKFSVVCLQNFIQKKTINKNELQDPLLLILI